MIENRKYIIGICGKKRHGKTALTTILSTLFNLSDSDVVILNFADYLKKVAEEVFNTKIGRFHKNLSLEERRLLLDLGDAFRAIDENCLVNYIERKIRKTGKNVIVGDVRLGIEAEMIKRAGGVIVRVVNPNVEHPELNSNDHKTETEIDGIKEDFRLFNDGKPISLMEKSKILFEKINEHYSKNQNYMQV